MRIKIPGLDKQKSCFGTTKGEEKGQWLIWIANDEIYFSNLLALALPIYNLGVPAMDTVIN